MPLWGFQAINHFEFHKITFEKDFKFHKIIQIIQVSFLAIWSLARGACRRFLTVQVTVFVSFQMFLDMTGLQIIYEIRMSIEHINLPEREAQCSLTAGTKENGN